MKSENCEPELVVTLKNEHHAVAPLYADGLEIVSRSCGFLLHITKGEASLGTVLADMKHRELIRLFSAEGVNDVKRKVEALLVFEIYLRKNSVFLGRNNEIVIYAARGVLLATLGSNRAYCDLLALSCRLIAKHYGVEGTIRASYRDHTVRRAGIVINGISGVKDLGVLSDLYLHLTGDNDIAFLPLVSHELYLLVLSAISVGKLHIERKRDTVAEA